MLVMVKNSSHHLGCLLLMFISTIRLFSCIQCLHKKYVLSCMLNGTCNCLKRPVKPLYEFVNIYLGHSYVSFYWQLILKTNVVHLNILRPSGIVPTFDRAFFRYFFAFLKDMNLGYVSSVLHAYEVACEWSLWPSVAGFRNYNVLLLVWPRLQRGTFHRQYKKELPPLKKRALLNNIQVGS